MSKVCLLVEAGFLWHHVGVRNLVMSLYKVLRLGHEVDFLSPYVSGDGTLQWFRIFPEFRSPQETSSAFVGSPKQVWDQYCRAKRKIENHGMHAYRIDIGDNLEPDVYSACFITVPWLINFHERLPFRKCYGIVYDLVPNIYVLTNTNKPHAFASAHLRGFRYFNKYCDGVIAISEATKRAYDQVFSEVRHKTHVLPPIMPSSYFDLPEEVLQRENSIVLAAPFDLRKGLALIPDLLNGVQDQLDVLYIYGSQRCEHKSMEAFFARLNVNKVCWIERASSDDVHDMYRKAKLLLFPSHEEGLGLPIIEAQLLGTRVCVKNAPPMSDLALPGSLILTGDMQQDAAAISEVLSDDCDHLALMRKARKVFATENVLRFVENFFDDPEKYATPVPQVIRSDARIEG